MGAQRRGRWCISWGAVGLAKETTSNRAAAEHIVKVLRSSGHVAYLAGGCVRDSLLGLSPKDHDVATSATPSEVRGMFRNTQAVGAAFGVILVRLGAEQIEVATFRTDGSYSDGRRPDAVRFASPEEDAQRRDFTINGLFLDPFSGEVVDYVGGRSDLEARVLRAIGNPDKRFGEDYLRLLRAVRFAARFELTLDPPTAAAIVRHAACLRRISPERVGEELRRMLGGPARARAFELLRELKLLPELFRFVEAPDRHDVDLFKLVAPGRDISFSLALAAGYFDDCYDSAAWREDKGAQLERAVKALDGLRRALRLSNEEYELLQGTLLSSLWLLLDELPRLSQKRRFLAMAHSSDVMELMRAVRSAGMFVKRVDELLPELEALQSQDNAPPPLVTGNDLIAAGLSPGKEFKRLLQMAYDAQLEARITGRDEALAYALSLQKGLGNYVGD